MEKETVTSFIAFLLILAFLAWLVMLTLGNFGVLVGFFPVVLAVFTAKVLTTLLSKD